MTGVPAAPSGRQPEAIRTALAVLRAVARSEPGISAQQVSSLLGLPPATTYRILALLVSEEYLVRVADPRGFALGPRVAEFVGADQHRRQATGLVPVVTGLRSATGLSVTLATYRRGAVHIAVADPHRPIPADDLSVGNLHASAVGRILLAATPQWWRLLPEPPLHRLTSHTVDDLADLDRELAKVRREAVAIQVEEVRLGLACVAVPVWDPAGVLRAGLTVSADPGSVARRLPELVAALQAAAAQLATWLRHGTA